MTWMDGMSALGADNKAAGLGGGWNGSAWGSPAPSGITQSSNGPWGTMAQPNGGFSPWSNDRPMGGFTSGLNASSPYMYQQPLGWETMGYDMSNPGNALQGQFGGPQAQLGYFGFPMGNGNMLQQGFYNPQQNVAPGIPYGAMAGWGSGGGLFL